MSGHSKWANIKHKKAAEDAKRGKVFSKISRNIRGAVREGGGDLNSNLNLRYWLDKAKEANMPKDNVRRAIDAGLGKGENGALQEVIYEGFDSQGVGLLIVCLTENKNRTTAELRNILSKSGGSLGSPGSVKYMFNRTKEGGYQPKITIPLQGDQQKAKLKTLVENLLELEDIEDVHYASHDLGEL
jgi:YebC/PmpR family DNA-binding regulatory protein